MGHTPGRLTHHIGVVLKLVSKVEVSDKVTARLLRVAPGHGGTDRAHLQRILNSLSLYQPMTHICVMVSPQAIRICMGDLILGVILQYMVSASFSCFLWLVKG